LEPPLTERDQLRYIAEADGKEIYETRKAMAQLFFADTAKAT
jgi:hypothetical protein